MNVKFGNKIFCLEMEPIFVERIRVLLFFTKRISDVKHDTTGLHSTNLYISVISMYAIQILYRFYIFPLLSMRGGRPYFLAHHFAIFKTMSVGFSDIES